MIPQEIRKAAGTMAFRFAKPAGFAHVGGQPAVLGAPTRCEGRAVLVPPHRLAVGE
jgi:hypothetical protein